MALFSSEHFWRIEWKRLWTESNYVLENIYLGTESNRNMQVMRNSNCSFQHMCQLIISKRCWTDHSYYLADREELTSLFSQLIDLPLDVGNNGILLILSQNQEIVLFHTTTKTSFTPQDNTAIRNWILTNILVVNRRSEERQIHESFIHWNMWEQEIRPLHRVCGEGCWSLFQLRTVSCYCIV